LESAFPFWTNLDARRKVIIVLATLGMFVAVIFLARSTAQKDLALLFGGLEPTASGEVITALEQLGAYHEVRGNGIYVEVSMRDSLRMSLAGDGLPTNGSRGYELLDGLSGFGTTSQMFDAAYWRAREGELARTILANPLISAARVHISVASSRPFSKEPKPTAAVTVTTNGASLGQQQIKALQYLVGAAVSGLAPADVAIIDDQGGLLSEAGEAAASAVADERADMLRQRAERLLAARVGAGNAVVELSLDTVSQTEQIIERTVDPESRIAISTDVTEAAETSQDSRGGDVTVASNLPDGAAGGSGSANSDSSETRSLTNYEFSQTERQVVIQPGTIRRMTVAVLVNDVVTTGPDGTQTTTPRSQEELASLQELVASAVGLDTERGDVITLRSLPFEDVPLDPELGTEVATLTTPLNVTQLIQAGLLAAVALVLGLFVVRPILSGATPAAAEGDVAALPMPDADGEEDIFANMGSAFDGGDFPGFGGGDFGDGGQLGGGDDNDAVERLRSLIAERENETVQLLQGWIEEGNQRESA